MEKTILDDLAGCVSFSRMYFGDNRDIKPNDYCFWSDFDFLSGWYETDAHFRDRIKKEISEK